MLHIDLRDGNGVHSDVTPDTLVARRTPRNGRSRPFVHIDAIAPDDTEWALLQEHFALHPLAVEDARQRGQRAKADRYQEHLFVSIHAPTTSESDGGELPTREIDLFVGPDFLIAVHDTGSTLLEAIRQRRRSALPGGIELPGHGLYLILDAVVDAYFPVLDALDEEIDAIETELYERGLSDLHPALGLKKRLLLLRQAVAPLRDVINQLLRIDEDRLIAAELRVFFQDVFDHALRLVEQVDLHRDILGTVLEAATAQAGNRLNQVMKTMTGVSTILMSLALIAGIYGMNFKNMPELHWSQGYFLALGLMGIIAIGLVIYFRRIKWF
jgi:magnesium transporter